MRQRRAATGIVLILVAVGILAVFLIRTNPSSTMPAAVGQLTLESPAFEDGGRIPAKYTCDENRELSPPLSFSGVPEGTKSLALIMDDPDVPKALKPDGVFDHWVLYNIPPEATGIPEGGMAGEAGANSSGAAEYTGPCPPPEHEPREHRYVFTLYALSDKLQFSEIPAKRQVLSALEPLILAKTELVGRYSRT